MPGLPGEREIKMEEQSFVEKIRSQIYSQFENEIMSNKFLLSEIHNLEITEIEVIENFKKKKIDELFDEIEKQDHSDEGLEFAGFLEYIASEYNKVARVFINKYSHGNKT